ncbi:hypothetical protein A2U01_0084340, partial [Trifolium medium]|nr:hypothetical protein [Trifolium medium]
DLCGFSSLNRHKYSFLCACRQMLPGAVLEVARGRWARWWRGSRQPSPVAASFGVSF